MYGSSNVLSPYSSEYKGGVLLLRWSNFKEVRGDVTRLVYRVSLEDKFAIYYFDIAVGYYLALFMSSGCTGIYEDRVIQDRNRNICVGSKISDSMILLAGFLPNFIFEFVLVQFIMEISNFKFESLPFSIKFIETSKSAATNSVIDKQVKALNKHFRV